MMTVRVDLMNTFSIMQNWRYGDRPLSTAVPVSNPQFHLELLGGVSGADNPIPS